MEATTIDDLRRWRRYLHANPELSLKEYNTAKYIRDELDKMGLKYETAMDTATIVCIKANNNSDESILLRADIDALPITELNEIDYKSQNEGVMHACGHDAHITMLLGAVKEILDLKNKGMLSVNVVAVFQPSEEAFGGAEILINSYDFKKFNIKASFALHVNPDYEEGRIVSRYGAIMARCNEFTVKVTGKSAHVGMRQDGINAMNTCVQIYRQFEMIPIYSLDSQHTNIIHIGKMNSGEVVNAVPQNGLIQGEIRTYNEDDFVLIKNRMKEICDGVAASSRSKVELVFSPSCPAVINDDTLMDLVEKSAVNSGAIYELKEEPYLLGEDFSYFSDLSPINYSFVGIRNKKLGYTSGLHTPTIQMREEALVSGVNFFVEIVKTYNN